MSWFGPDDHAAFDALLPSRRNLRAIVDNTAAGDARRDWLQVLSGARPQVRQGPIGTAAGLASPAMGDLDDVPLGVRTPSRDSVAEQPVPGVAAR